MCCLVSGQGLRIWRPITEILKLVDSCPTRANMEFLDPKMHLAGRVARPYWTTFFVGANPVFALFSRRDQHGFPTKSFICVSPVIWTRFIQDLSLTAILKRSFVLLSTSLGRNARFDLLFPARPHARNLRAFFFPKDKTSVCFQILSLEEHKP
jgi:hypothetical protein